MSETKDESIAYPIMIGCYSKIPHATTNSKKTRITGAVYAGGVKNLLLLENGEIIVGAGDGTVESIEIVKSDAAAAAAFVKNGYEKLLVLPCIITVMNETIYTNSKIHLKRGNR